MFQISWLLSPFTDLKRLIDPTQTKMSLTWRRCGNLRYPLATFQLVVRMILMTGHGRSPSRSESTHPQPTRFSLVSWSISHFNFQPVSPAPRQAWLMCWCMRKCTVWPNKSCTKSTRLFNGMACGTVLPRTPSSTLDCLSSSETKRCSKTPSSTLVLYDASICTPVLLVIDPTWNSEISKR